MFSVSCFANYKTCIYVSTYYKNIPTYVLQTWTYLKFISLLKFNLFYPLKD